MEIDPPFEDGFGYRVRTSDLQFLGITSDAVNALWGRLCPLGISPPQFRQFVRSLHLAADRDEIADLDVRLKGSSAEFFSGYHKRMAWTRDDVLELFRQEQARLPEPHELDGILATLESVWPKSARPTRRLFDALYRTNISPEPSDVDIQVSSDDVDARARAKIAELGVEPSSLTINSPIYNFIRKDIVEDVCPFLRLWAIRQTSLLRRLVTMAVFPGSGPPNTESSDGPLSSHHKHSDWIIFRRSSS
jgi:hypothetical protein